jgi:putative hydrolase of the HAD superfamily
MTLREIRALFFDVGGTLIEPWPSVGAIYSAVAARHGINADADTMESAFHAAWRQMKMSAAPGALTVSRRDWWRALVWRTLERAGAGPAVAGRQPEACFEELYAAFARADAWRVFPDGLAALQETRARGLHVGLISNWDQRLRPLLERLDLARYCDSVTVSCDVGAEKPDPAIFKAALAAAGVAPGESLHAGDAPDEDVRGARAAGMHAVLVKRRPVRANGCVIVANLGELFI